MAGIKISALPAAASAQLTDVFPIDGLPGPVTYKETNAQLLTLFQANGVPLTRTNDTNVTLTLGGSPTIALLNPTSMTLGWTGELSGSRGGTGVNNGASTITLGGSLTTVGAFDSTFTMTAPTNVTFPTSGTLATTFGTVSSVSGTANRITSTGGTTPVIDISASYVGQSSITTVGALASGSLAAGFTPVTVPLGGTGNTTFTPYSVICAGTTATGTFQNVSGLGNAGEALFSNGAGLLPTWQPVSTVTPAALTEIDDTNVTLTLGGTPSTALLQATSITAGWTGQLSVARGGTGVASATAYGLIFGGTTSTGPFQSLTSGASTRFLQGAGTSALPAWSSYGLPSSGSAGQLLYFSGSTSVVGLSTNASATRYVSNTGASNGPAWAQVNLANGVTGTLPEANGGTGITALGTGVATWLGTPSSANLAAAVTDETGTGALVFANTPTLVTPVLGAATATSINFGGSTLNTYAESTSWTPTMTFATPGDLSIVYTTQVGTYSRIGNIVYLTFILAFTPTFTTASGSFQVTGLPFTIGASCVGTVQYQTSAFPAGTTYIYLRGTAAQSLLTINASGSSTSTTAMTTTQVTTGAAVTMLGTITHLV